MQTIAKPKQNKAVEKFQNKLQCKTIYYCITVTIQYTVYCVWADLTYCVFYSV